MEWKKRWHPRGDSGARSRQAGPGPRDQYLGRRRPCQPVPHRPSIRMARCCSKSARRIWAPAPAPIITMVAAETLGLPMGAITLRIGNSDYPPDGASGGSTTVGGVSPPRGNPPSMR